MSELVVLHRDADRFDLLYRSLWRLVYEPELKNDFGDADLVRLRQMAQAVRRDIQKMKTRLVFRPLDVRGEPTAFAWYEPAHYVSETVGAWLARGDGPVRWVLLTPDRSMRWDGEKLLSAPAVAPLPDPLVGRSEREWAAMLDAMPWL
nr:DUF4130 domain-containing protein [Ramlibacter cellulosilyticus]